MRMRNSQLIEAYVNGAINGSNHSQNLYIDNNKLINYSTTIAERVGNKIIINITKYSQTTTVHQNALVRMAKSGVFQYALVENVNQGSYTITDKELIFA